MDRTALYLDKADEAMQSGDDKTANFYAGLAATAVERDRASSPLGHVLPNGDVVGSDGLLSGVRA